MNPTDAKPGAGDAGFAKASSLSGMSRKYNTSATIVQKLQRLYRVSKLHAETIARLASLGPQEGR